MEIVSIRSMIVILLSLGLGACGGGGGGGGGNGSGGGGANVTPTASTGFATSASTFDSNVTFVPDSENITARTTGGSSASERPANIELRFTDNGDDLAMIILGRQYNLTENGASRYTGPGPTPSSTIDLFIERTSTNGDAKLARARSPSEIFGKDIYFAYGFDTNPDTVSAETGTATYTGVIEAIAVQGPAGRYAGGNITLNVDFTDGDVSGNFNLGAFSGMTGSTNFVLTEADIEGNGFSGTFQSGTDDLDSGQTLSSATYDGRFFGTDAGAAGGAISATITESGEEPIYVQGAFLAE